MLIWPPRKKNRNRPSGKIAAVAVDLPERRDPEPRVGVRGVRRVAKAPVGQYRVRIIGRRPIVSECGGRHRLRPTQSRVSEG